MKQIFILTMLLSFSKLTFGQTYSSLTSDKDIYAFLNWLVANDVRPSESPRFKKKCVANKIIKWDDTDYKDEMFSRFILSFKGVPKDSIITHADRKYLYQQIMAQKDTIWHDKFIHSKLIFAKTQKKTNRHYYSIPIFSVDKSYVIVQKEYYCGNLCAYGGYYIYRRMGNAWALFTSFDTWIS